MPFSCSQSATLTLETPVVVPAGWWGAPATAGGARRLPLREVFARMAPTPPARDGARHGPGMIDLAAALVDVPPGEVLGDDSPTTTAVNAVARRLAVLRRAWRTGAGTGAP